MLREIKYTLLDKFVKQLVDIEKSVEMIEDSFDPNWADEFVDVIDTLDEDLSQGVRLRKGLL